MTRGGKRRGSPGKSYANRSDMNVDRAPQPGSSALAPPVVQQQPTVEEQAMAHVSPDSFPNLTDPTNYPDIPPTNGVTGGPGDNFNPMLTAKNFSQPFAEALAVFPGDPDLLRMARYIRARRGL